ncbi:MAG: CotH kinase family protein [Chitinophagaceae bacterium]|nr:CotH kinase family protein [Chitinophagaceae bacterium]
MRKILLGLFLLAFGQTMNAQDVVVNEYSCSNINTFLDAYNQYEDWVELYNATGTNINLTGYYLSDDPADIQKWQIPTVTDITPGGRKMVIPSNRGLVAANGQIHPDFKLTQTKGEWFILADPSGNIVDSVKLQLTQRGHSRGRVTDGSPNYGIFTTPTPNATNNTQTAYVKYATTPIMSVPGGNYAAAQTVAISTPDPLVTLYYTINGVNPTATSTVYAAPINVAATTVVRARAYSSDPTVLPSFVESNTIFINETCDNNFIVISLSGPYNAASAGGNQTLFGNSANIWTSIECYNSQFNLQWEQEGQGSRHGNDSWAYAQKGMDFEAFDETGTRADFDGQFFNTTVKDKFNRFILKNAGSDNWPLGPSKACHIRDVWAQTLAEKFNLDMDFRRYCPASIYINGQYWGVYDMRERVDREFFKYYYNKDASEVDHLSYWGGLNIRMGSDTGWNNLYNYIMNAANPMSDPAKYAHVKEFLNTRSFIQYFIFNEYLVNHDWLNWNTMWWRARGNNPVKWRYVLWDEDAIVGLNNPNYTGLNNIGPYNDPCDASQNFLNNSAIKHTDMLNKLMASTEFKQQWDQEWLDMLLGPLDCSNTVPHFDSLIAVITPEMPKQATRWGGTMADFNQQVDSMRSWLLQRCSFIAQGIDTCYDLNPQLLKLNVSPPNTGVIALDGVIKSPYVWSKTIEGDSIYTLQATPTAGPYWTFDHWEKQEPTNNFLPNNTTNTVQFDFKKKDSVIAYFKYFNYDSVKVTFDVTPPGAGTIALNGVTIPFYPATYTLDRRFTYNIVATKNPSYRFMNWSKNNSTTNINPDLISKAVTFDYKDPETIVANFDFIPPPPPPPGLSDVIRDVFIPNAFSPNGDGTNDVFNIKLGMDAIGMDMKIFDRWGNEVFHGNKLEEGWDGKFKGKAMDIGTYQYLIKVRFRDKSEEVFTGDVSLIR